MATEDENFDAWVPGDDQELRTEFRLTGRVWVGIEVESADVDGSGEARTLRCTTRDLSASGISISASEPLPEGALLPVTLVIDDENRFLLMAEVRWCRTVPEQEGYQIGLAILDSDETTFLEWKEAIAQLMTSS